MVVGACTELDGEMNAVLLTIFKQKLKLVRVDYPTGEYMDCCYAWMGGCL